MGLFKGPNVQKLKDQQDFRGLAKSLCSDDPAVRSEAVQAVTDLASPDAVPAIVDAAASRSGDDVLDAVGQALHGIGESAATRLVQIISAGQSERSVVAIALLGRMGDEHGLSALRNLIAQSSSDSRADVTTRSLAALSLGNVGTSAIDTVITLLDDSTAPVRLAAAMTLENHPDPRAADALRRLTSDDDPAVRDQATKALAALNQP